MSYKDFAIDVAKKAAKIMLANFSLDMKKDWKDDNTPVTVTDTTINGFVATNGLVHDQIIKLIQASL